MSVRIFPMNVEEGHQKIKFKTKYRCHSNESLLYRFLSFVCHFLQECDESKYYIAHVSLIFLCEAKDLRAFSKNTQLSAAIHTPFVHLMHYTKGNIICHILAETS